MLCGVLCCHCPPFSERLSYDYLVIVTENTMSETTPRQGKRKKVGRKRKEVVVPKDCQWTVLEYLGYQLRDENKEPTGEYTLSHEVASRPPQAYLSAFYVLAQCDRAKGGCGAVQAVNRYAIEHNRSRGCARCSRRKIVDAKGLKQDRKDRLEKAIREVEKKGEPFTISELTQAACVPYYFIHNRAALWNRVRNLQDRLEAGEGQRKFVERSAQRRQPDTGTVRLIGSDPREVAARGEYLKRSQGKAKQRRAAKAEQQNYEAERMLPRDSDGQGDRVALVKTSVQGSMSWEEYWEGR